MLRQRALVRVTSVVSAFLFFHLEMAALLQGHVAVARAMAQGKERRVAVFVLSTRNAGEAQALQTVLRTQLKNVSGVRVVTGSPDPDQRVEVAAGPLVEDGIRALNDRNAALAESHLQKAYDLLIRDTGPTQRRLLARTTKGLGVARVMLGRKEEGKDMIRASLNVWPDQQASDYGYTLDVRNAFKEVENDRLNQNPGSIAIFTEPAGAEISSAGEVKGFATADGLTLSNLMPGPHWFSAQLDGYKRAGDFVNVEPGQESMQTFALEPMPSAQAFQQATDTIAKNFRTESKISGAITGLKGLVGADDVIVYLHSKRGDAFLFNGWHLNAQGQLQQVSGNIKQDAAFMTSIQNMLASTLGSEVAGQHAELPLDPPPGASNMAGGGDEVFIDPKDKIFDDPSSNKRSLTSEWWFWAILGGAAAGLTLAVIAIGGESESAGPVGDIVIGVNGPNGQ